MSIVVAIGTSIRDNRPENRSFATIDDFENFILSPPTVLAGLTPTDIGTIRFKSAKTSLPYIIGGPTDYAPEGGSGGWRGLGNFSRIHVLIVDIDLADQQLAEEIRTGTGALSGLRYVWHTTISATAEAPKFRIFFPLIEPIAATDQHRLYLAIKGSLDTEHGKVDEKSAGAAHVMFLPGHVDGGFFDAGANLGINQLDGHAILAGLPAEEQPKRPAPEAPGRPQTGDLRASESDSLDSHWRRLMEAAGAVFGQSPRRKTELTTNCPWHADTNPSLDVDEKGRLVCRAGCKADDGANLSWLRYVAKVRGEDLSQAASWARKLVNAETLRRESRIDPMAEFVDLDAVERQMEEDYAFVIEPDDIFGFLPLNKLPKKEINPDDRLWGDAIIKGAVTVISGQPGIGKSTLIRYVAQHIADGKSYLNKDVPAKKSVVAVVDFETPDVFRRPFWREVYGDEIDSVGNIFVSTTPARITKESAVRLVKQLQTIGADLVIVDTISAGFDIENENDNSEMEQVARLLKGIANKGFAVLAIAHPSKGGHGIRGASALEGAIDTVVQYRSVEKISDEGPDETTDFVLVVTKNRLGTMSSEKIRWDGDGGFTAPNALTTEELTRADQVVTDIVVGHRPKPMRTDEILSIAAVAGVSNRTAKRSIKKLSDNGIIKKVRHGFYG
jgi:nucleoside-triphosphatase THEP1